MPSWTSRRRRRLPVKSVDGKIWGGCGAQCPACPFNADSPVMFDKSADKLIEQNTDRFISGYSNQKFTDYPAYPDYFIDCYERYCPDGCDVECPGSEEGFLPVVQPKRVSGDIQSLMPILPKSGNCPKKEKRVYMRAHIGELTEDEVKLIRDTSRADALIVFRQVEDIPRNTPEEENEHSKLLANFESFKIADRQGLSRQKRLQITIAMSVMKKASDFRKARKRAWGYASIMGNIPGISAEQPSVVKKRTKVSSKRSIDRTAESTANDGATTGRAPGKSKYDELVEVLVEQSIKAVVAGKAKKLITNKAMVEVLKNSNIFEDGNVPEDRSIKRGIERNPAWINRKEALAKAWREADLGETYQNRQKSDKRRGGKKMGSYADVNNEGRERQKQRRKQRRK